MLAELTAVASRPDSGLLARASAAAKLLASGLAADGGEGGVHGAEGGLDGHHVRAGAGTGGQADGRCRGEAVELDEACGGRPARASRATPRPPAFGPGENVWVLTDMAQTVGPALGWARAEWFLTTQVIGRRRGQPR